MVQGPGLVPCTFTPYVVRGLGLREASCRMWGVVYRTPALPAETRVLTLYFIFVFLSFDVLVRLYSILYNVKLTLRGPR